MDLLHALTETCRETLGYFVLPEEDLQKTYLPGKWNVRQLLHHLADAESVLYDRLWRVIAEPKPEIWAFDQDRWCQQLNYLTFLLEINKAIYASIREAVIQRAQTHYAIPPRRPSSTVKRAFVRSRTNLKK